jgi:hypothetical protein
MTAFLWTFIVLEGLAIVGRLVFLANGRRIEKSGREIALDCIVSVGFLAWAIVLLARAA